MPAVTPAQMTALQQQVAMLTRKVDRLTLGFEKLVSMSGKFTERDVNKLYDPNYVDEGTYG